MSLITAFPFYAYVGDLKTRHVVSEKTAVSLSLLSPEDMARMAFVEVRTRCGQEDKTAPWRPVIRNGEEHATFYDPRMGNFDMRTFPPHSCQTCAANLTGKFGNERCHGHFGFIGMPRLRPGDAQHGGERMFVMNPHLVEEVEQLLQAKCFFCHRFRAPLFNVERHRQALLLIDCGLIGEALHLLDVVSNARAHDAWRNQLHTANEEVVNDVTLLEEHVERIRKEHKHASSMFNNNNNSGENKSGKIINCYNSENTNNYNNNNNKGTTRTTIAAATGKTDIAGVTMGKEATDVRNDVVKRALRELKEYISVCSHCRGISPRITKRNGHFFFFFKKSSAALNVSNAFLSESQLREWEETNKLHRRGHTYFCNQDIREHIKQLCQREEVFLALLFPHLGEPSVKTPHHTSLPAREVYKVFFVDRILVPPLPLRLSSGAQVQDSGAISPDTQTRALSDMLGFVEQIECYQVLLNNSTPERRLVSTAQEIANEINLRNLQVKVNEFYKDILDSFAKKEGLFRLNMMGKRVNQACRSVISPDPLVEPNEVVLPRPFARSLSFPEQVTFYAPARINLLKRCVINGPHRYPGATHLEIRHSNGEVYFIYLDVPEQTRRQHAAKYFAMAQSNITLIVYRHVVDGDHVVFNRQPTLHKPSMLGYRVKVLSGYKTLRFHYVNGSSFNADFDGDEMNIHVPQSLEAKAEVSSLMDANLNYIVPTSGKPIRGLIQDHIASGVLLTLRDKFLDHSTFVQLSYYGLAPYLHHNVNGVTLSELIPLPAILRPRPLWTGKQLISVVTRFVSGSQGGASMKGASLIQPSMYNTTVPGFGNIKTFTRRAMDDDAVLFMNSELLIGLMCKKQLGASSMSIAHVLHELYGPHKVGMFFGALGRILTQFLQREGFSLGMDDLLLVQEERRCLLLRELDEAPLHCPDDEEIAMTKITEHATKLQQEFVPARLMVPFPRNHLLLMTSSGAKGSNANTTQMTLSLGQQLFDGQRVKRMNSGKTLPAFFVHECRGRSFGFASGCFASGIRPAEYTIHAMAGRDGLIDTAVKTSRSGHLQRCLIKGLESLVVHWDHSVRDSNGSIIQFIYGGDGLDPCKASTLTSWEMAKDNMTELCKRFGVDTGDSSAEFRKTKFKGLPADEKNFDLDEQTRIQRFKRSHAADNNCDGDGFNDYTKQEARQQQHREQQLQENPLPHNLLEDMEKYLRSKATFPLFQRISQVLRWRAQQKVHEKLLQKREENIAYYRDVLTELTASKRIQSFCEPGEPVGLLAAQAAGEPSTQMTLNTFHSAGSTVTHVTEGIPRLRELLIHASVQNAAVIVPVENVTPADEATIVRVIQAGVAIKLRDCLVRGGAGGGKGYHYHVARHKEVSVLTIALLFSRTLLGKCRERMCMSPSEHVEFFTESLQGFAKRIIKVLRGRTREEKEVNSRAAAATINQQDVMDVAAAAADADDDDNDVEKSSFGENSNAPSDDDSDVTKCAVVGAVSPPLSSRRYGAGRPIASKSTYDEDDDDDDEDNDKHKDDDYLEMEEEEGEKEGRPKKNTRSTAHQRNGPLCAKENEEEEEEEEDDDDYVDSDSDENYEREGNDNDNDDNDKRSATSQHGASYSNFAPLHFVFGGKKFILDIAPLNSEAARRDGVVSLPEDLFIVNIVLCMPADIIAVIPDVVDSALEQQTIPSWLPQFSSITFTREADDLTSGKLIFQGSNARMRQVLSFLSLFTVGTRAIKVQQARSTDIRDMANWLGVESAYCSLYDELSKLFRRYSVDHRHLSLIADAATHRGMWENFNFTGVISQSASPLFQMTFASSKRWLHTAISRGLSDELQSISSAIMVGERPKVGTASVKLTPDATVLRDVLERNF